QRRNVESGAEAGDTMLKQVLEALVRVLRGAESRELAHGPQPAAVHGRLRAAGIGKLAGEAEIALVLVDFRVARLPDVRGDHQIGDGNPRVGVEFRTAQGALLRDARELGLSPFLSRCFEAVLGLDEREITRAGPPCDPAAALACARPCGARPASC